MLEAALASPAAVTRNNSLLDHPAHQSGPRNYLVRAPLFCVCVCLFGKCVLCSATLLVCAGVCRCAVCACTRVAHGVCMRMRAFARCACRREGEKESGGRWWRTSCRGSRWTCRTPP